MLSCDATEKEPVKDGDVISSMLPVLLVYARLMTSSPSSVSLRVRVTISLLAVISSTVGFEDTVVDNTKSPGAAEFTVISSDKVRLMVVVLAVPMDTTVGGALSVVPVKVWSSAGIAETSVTVPDDAV